MVSKMEIMGEELLTRIHVHNQDIGGIFSLTTGAPGQGKTSVLLAFADYTGLHHKEDKIFWSECYVSPLQVFKLKHISYEFWVQDDIDVVFKDRTNKLAIVDLPFKKFSSYADLYSSVKPGCANVVFFSNRMYWMDFIDYLRGVGEWCNVFIEEIGEIIPSYQKGAIWERIDLFSKSVLKDIRKCLMNVHANTQMKTNIDYRALNQVMMRIFLPGARPDFDSRVQQRAVDNLRRNIETGNQAFLDNRGQFGLTTFKDIYKPNGRDIGAYIVGGEREYKVSSFRTDEKT